MLMEQHHADKFPNNVITENEVPIGPPALAIPTTEEKVNKKNISSQKYASSLKKKRGAMQMLKVALFMLRHRSKKSKSLQVEVASKGIWKRFLGSMRPLHLQSQSSPPPAAFNHENFITNHNQADDASVYSAPMSPAGSSEASMSRYASAVNLQELDNNGGEADEHDIIVGDEMIDAKAEEFIAQFYEQIRLQRLDSMDLRYEEMIVRSLG
ncbi:Cotton fiber protein [Quillaja saponaria]|uniref:Cotton fiber protein n=1 Tax=Quillaja saponaria TaxID=32244 RepID=A0AAD7Q1G3_QUISA|nr:Cotton fiber protein [Quillaja saponaria]